VVVADYRQSIMKIDVDCVELLPVAESDSFNGVALPTINFVF
jgi:hypothetical protein